MNRPNEDPIELTPELLLRAYALGVFPMAEHREDADVFWVQPKRRGTVPLDSFHVTRRLKRTVRNGPFEVSCDTAFRDVMVCCAEATEHRDETWINAPILAAYTELHQLGFAHSVECRIDGELVGGLYGISLGAAFFGESMFSRARDASKIAMVHLVARLKYAGYTLLDTQFITDHLKQFGAVEISAKRYTRLLNDAIAREATFYSGALTPELSSVLESVLRQSSTQTS